jgi:bifunctional DNase/RNase
VDAGARRPVLLLQEASGDHRLLPVWIGIAEANAITMEQQRISLTRAR